MPKINPHPLHTTLHTPALSSPLMPPKPRTKQWGHEDKKCLFNLVKTDAIDITDTSLKNIQGVQQAYFSHWVSRIFRRNFCNFVASLNLETEYSSARQHKAGKLRILYFI